jgi:hypothetical protein
VILYAMLLGTLIAVGAAGSVYIREHVAHHSPSTKNNPPGKGENNRGGGGEAGRWNEGDDSGGNVDAETTAGEPCPHLPSRDAPAWARDNLNALYYSNER